MTTLVIEVTSEWSDVTTLASLTNGNNVAAKYTAI